MKRRHNVFGIVTFITALVLSSLLEFPVLAATSGDLSEDIMIADDVEAGDNLLSGEAGMISEDENVSEEISDDMSGDISDMVRSDMFSLDAAVPIAINSTYSGNLTNGNKYYSFSLGSDGVISVDFEHEYEDSSSVFWVINIYNKNDINTNLTKWEFIGNATTRVTTESLGLPAGDYIAEIAQNWYSSKNFSFKINYTACLNWEKEANNTPVTATPIRVNTEMNGCLQFGNDIDFYVFETDAPGRIRIAFDHDLLDNSYEYWRIKLYSFDDLNNTILEKGFIGNATSTEYSPYVGLPTGKFIISIEDNWTSLTDYCIYIDFQISEYWEKEKNDNLSSATDLKVNTEMNGSLQTGNDIDYYKFNLSGNDVLSVSFSHDFLSDNHEYWVFEMYDYKDVNDRLIRFGFVGNETDTVIKSIGAMSSGSYIIKISHNWYSDVKYSFCINSMYSDVNVTGVKLNTDSLSMTVSETQMLTASISPSNATNQNISWTTSDKGIATVDEDGRVYAVSPGNAVITVTTADGGYTAAALITVASAASDGDRVTGISIEPETLSLSAGGVSNLTAVLYPLTAQNKNVTWKSSNESVAIVDAAGKIYAVSGGTAIVYATTEDGGFVASALIKVATDASEVVAPPATDETDSDCYLSRGQKIVLSDYFSVDNIAKFVPSKKGIVSISKGILTGKKQGTVDIEAFVKDGKQLRSIGVSRFTVEVPKFTQKLKGTYEGEVVYAGDYLSDAGDLDVESWKSSKPAVASIDEDTGDITVLKKGTTTITAFFGEGKYAGKATVSLTVTIPTLSKKSVTMLSGANTTIKLNKAVGTPEWFSSDESIAEVDENGSITAHSAGNVDIIAQLNGIDYICSVTVKQPTLSIRKVTLASGKTKKISLKNTRLTNVLWESSDDSVAYVENGMIVAVAPGQAEITTEAGGCTEVCIVTVK